MPPHNLLVCMIANVVSSFFYNKILQSQTGRRTLLATDAQRNSSRRRRSLKRQSRHCAMTHRQKGASVAIRVRCRGLNHHAIHDCTLDLFARRQVHQDGPPAGQRGAGWVAHRPTPSGGFALASNGDAYFPLPSRGRGEHVCATVVMATPGVNRDVCGPCGWGASGGVVE